MALTSCLQSLLLRKSVKVPVYDFVTHSRKEETIQVDPADVIIVEAGVEVQARPCSLKAPRLQTLIVKRIAVLST